MNKTYQGPITHHPGSGMNVFFKYYYIKGVAGKTSNFVVTEIVGL